VLNENKSKLEISLTNAQKKQFWEGSAVNLKALMFLRNNYLRFVPLKNVLPLHKSESRRMSFDLVISYWIQ